MSTGLAIHPKILNKAWRLLQEHIYRLDVFLHTQETTAKPDG